MIRKFLILYPCFLLIETLISVILSLIYCLFAGYGSYYYNSINVPIGLNFWRLLFYSIPMFLIFLLVFKCFNRIDIYKPYIFSIFNVLVFSVLNLLYKLHKGLPSLEFTESLFWITIISIFLAPVLLYQISYFKRLMENGSF